MSDNMQSTKPSEIPRISTADLTIDQVPIGIGAYGYVYKATHAVLGTVAIKTMIADGILPLRHQRVFQTEGKKLWQLNHPSIVQLLGLIMEEGNYSLVLEYMHLGSLTAFLSDFPNTAPSLRICILHDVAAGMKYLHGMETCFLHLDLKSDNILINRHIRAKITDFGLSQWKTMTRTMTGRSAPLSSAGGDPGATGSAGHKGTVTHIPPEVWSNVNTAPSPAYDVYSFAIVIWETLTGQRPFNLIKEDIIPKAVLSGQRPDLYAIPKVYPQFLITLMKKAWEQQPDKRPSFPAIQAEIETCFRSMANQVRKALAELEQEIQNLYPPEDLGGDTNQPGPVETLLDLAEVIIPKKLADIDRELQEKRAAEEAAKAKIAAEAAAPAHKPAAGSVPASIPAAIPQEPPKPKTTLDLITEDPVARAKLLRQILRDPVQMFLMEKNPSLLKSAFQIDDSVKSFLRDPKKMAEVFKEDPLLKYEMMRRGYDYLGWLYTPLGVREGYRKKQPHRAANSKLIEEQAKAIKEKEEKEKEKEEEMRKLHEQMSREGYEGSRRRVAMENIAHIFNMPRREVVEQLTTILQSPSMLRHILSDKPLQHLPFDPEIVEMLRDPGTLMTILQSDPKLYEIIMREDSEIINKIIKSGKHRGMGKSLRSLHPMMLERELRGMDLDEDDYEDMMESRGRLMHMMMNSPKHSSSMHHEPMDYMSSMRMHSPRDSFEGLYEDPMDDLMGKPPQKKVYKGLESFLRGKFSSKKETQYVKPTKEHFSLVADNIGTDWKQLGQKLGFALSWCDQLDQNESFKTQHDKVIELLEKWTLRNKEFASVELIARALKQANRQDLADKLVQLKTTSAPGTATTSK